MATDPKLAVETRLERLERRLLRLRTKLGRLSKSRGDSRQWQFFVIVFPVCVTVLGGLFVDRRLARLSDELKAGEQHREVLLRLAETLYNERLKVYIAVDQALLNIEERVREGRLYADTESPSRHRLGLNEATIKLRELYRGQRLYLTPQLIESLENVVRSANSASQADRIMPAHLDRLLKSTQTTRGQMTTDLRPDAVSVNPLYSTETEPAH